MKDFWRLSLLIPLLYGTLVPLTMYDHYVLFLHPARVAPDSITDNERRLASARCGFQPFERCGYLTPELLTHPQERLHYNLALYTLAPTLLLLDPRMNRILVDVPPGFAPLPADRSYRKVSTLAPGATLYERVKP